MHLSVGVSILLLLASGNYRLSIIPEKTFTITFNFISAVTVFANFAVTLPIITINQNYEPRKSHLNVIQLNPDKHNLIASLIPVTYGHSVDSLPPAIINSPYSFASKQPEICSGTEFEKLNFKNTQETILDAASTDIEKISRDTPCSPSITYFGRKPVTVKDTTVEEFAKKKNRQKSGTKILKLLNNTLYSKLSKIPDFKISLIISYEEWISHKVLKAWLGFKSSRESRKTCSDFGKATIIHRRIFETVSPTDKSLHRTNLVSREFHRKGRNGQFLGTRSASLSKLALNNIFHTPLKTRDVSTATDNHSVSDEDLDENYSNASIEKKENRHILVHNHETPVTVQNKEDHTDPIKNDDNDVQDSEHPKLPPKDHHLNVRSVFKYAFGETLGHTLPLMAFKALGLGPLMGNSGRIPSHYDDYGYGGGGGGMLDYGDSYGGGLGDGYGGYGGGLGGGYGGGLGGGYGGYGGGLGGGYGGGLGGGYGGGLGGGYGGGLGGGYGGGLGGGYGGGLGGGYGGGLGGGRVPGYGRNSGANGGAMDGPGNYDLDLGDDLEDGPVDEGTNQDQYQGSKKIHDQDPNEEQDQNEDQYQDLSEEQNQDLNEELDQDQFQDLNEEQDQGQGSNEDISDNDFDENLNHEPFDAELDPIPDRSEPQDTQRPRSKRKSKQKLEPSSGAKTLHIHSKLSSQVNSSHNSTSDPLVHQKNSSKDMKNPEDPPAI
ncbi:hypothetical protein K3495_g6532 [Podosphaera aphanis]|nr:hypothetical protein K3495_g6532 [Podosphaera aphanis]